MICAIVFNFLHRPKPKLTASEVLQQASKAEAEKGWGEGGGGKTHPCPARCGTARTTWLAWRRPHRSAWRRASTGFCPCPPRPAAGWARTPRPTPCPAPRTSALKACTGVWGGGGWLCPWPFGSERATPHLRRQGPALRHRSFNPRRGGGRELGGEREVGNAHAYQIRGEGCGNGLVKNRE